MVHVFLDDGIAFGEQACERVDDARGAAAVQHLQAWVVVVILRDIDKAAAGNQRAQDGAVEDGVRVVHLVNGGEIEVVVPEAVKLQPVRQAVDRLAAPAKSKVVCFIS